MLIKILWVLGGLGLILVGFFFIRLMMLAQESQKFQFPSSEGLGEAIELKDCPSTPNCYRSQMNWVGDARKDLPRVKKVIEEMGGDVVVESSEYLRAEFKSLVFGFVDDLEVKAEPEQYLFRSASRVGYSDLDKNRQRIEALEAGLSGLIQP